MNILVCGYTKVNYSWLLEKPESWACNRLDDQRNIYCESGYNPIQITRRIERGVRWKNVDMVTVRKNLIG